MPVLNLPTVLTEEDVRNHNLTVTESEEENVPTKPTAAVLLQAGHTVLGGQW